MNYLNNAISAKKRARQMKIEKEILELYALWDATQSHVIAENVEKKIFEVHNIKNWEEKLKTLANLTGSSNHAVYAWMNRGRERVKIPFIKLCMIAQEYGLSMRDLLT